MNSQWGAQSCTELGLNTRHNPVSGFAILTVQILPFHRGPSSLQRATSSTRQFHLIITPRTASLSPLPRISLLPAFIISWFYGWLSSSCYSSTLSRFERHLRACGCCRPKFCSRLILFTSQLLLLRFSGTTNQFTLELLRKIVINNHVLSFLILLSHTHTHSFSLSQISVAPFKTHDHSAHNSFIIIISQLALTSCYHNVHRPLFRLCLRSFFNVAQSLFWKAGGLSGCFFFFNWNWQVLLWLAGQLTPLGSQLIDLPSLWPAGCWSKLLMESWAVWSSRLVGAAQTYDLRDRLYCKSGSTSLNLSLHPAKELKGIADIIWVHEWLKLLALRDNPGKT